MIFQIWIATCPACQVSERLKIGVKWQAEFASVYTLALLAKNVIALKYQAYQQLVAVAYLSLANHFLALSLAQQSIQTKK